MGGHLIAGALPIVVGLVVTFWGYRLLKFTLIVSSFAFGAYLGWVLTSRAGAVNWLIIVCAIASGIIAILLTVWFFKLSVFLAGAVAGALITSVFSGGTQLLVVLIGALVGGVAGALLQRPVLSLLTAFLGAWVIVAGFFNLFGISRLRLGSGVDMPLMAILWLGVGIAGSTVQFFYTSRKKEQNR